MVTRKVMLERVQFLAVYFGSAAMAAFMAACLSSAHLATFPCDTSGAIGANQCELAATMTAAVPEAGMMNSVNLTPDVPGRESLITAASD